MSSTEHEAQYAAWAARLRTKQVAVVAANRPDAEPESAEGADNDSFDMDAFAVGARHEQSGTTGVDVSALLAVFDLEPDASMEDVTAAFRALVKAHHPDQYSDGDPATRDTNDQLLRSAEATYRTLAKELDGGPRAHDVVE